MAKLTDYSSIQHDRRNANKGTERGRYMVEASLREAGAGRSILLDRNGNVIAGNKTFEAASDIGLPLRIVETDGSELVAVQRNDLDLDDATGMARKLAYYDNRASQVGLDWDAEVLLGDLAAGVDLSGMFRQDELDAIIAGLNGIDVPDVGPQKEPIIQSEVVVEIHCTKLDLDDLTGLIDGWRKRSTVTVNIS